MWGTNTMHAHITLIYEEETHAYNTLYIMWCFQCAGAAVLQLRVEVSKCCSFIHVKFVCKPCGRKTTAKEEEIFVQVFQSS